MEPMDAVSQWDKIVRGLKEWPWPYFLAIAIAGGVWGWLNYQDANREIKRLNDIALGSTQDANDALKKVVKIQESVLSESYKKQNDTTKH